MKLRAGVLFASGLLLCTPAARAADAVIVAPPQLSGWTLGDEALAELSSGPAQAPLGAGSLRLRNTTPDEGVVVDYTGLEGRLLKDLSELRFHTYVVRNGGCNSPYLLLTLDINEDGKADDGLVFEPCYQVDPWPQQGPVQLDQWQAWDALRGGWWLRTGGPPLFSLEAYLKEHPGARLVKTNAGRGSLRLAAGYGVPILGNIDALTVAFGADRVTFDFEERLPAPPPDLAPPAPDLGAEEPPPGCQCRAGWRGDGGIAGAWVGALLLLGAVLRPRKRVRS